MSKQVRIQIFADGRVQAEVQGVKGKTCTNYLALLEEALNAETISSNYTPEYFEEQTVQVQLSQEAQLHQRGQ